MAQPPKSPSGWRKFFGWFGRHKIAAVFAVLILALSIYLTGALVVRGLGAHQETARFVKAENQMARLGAKLAVIGSVTSQNYCFYESSTTEFVKGQRLCVSRLSVVAPDMDKATATVASDKAQAIVLKSGVVLKDDPGSAGSTTLLAKSFSTQQIGCAFDSEYYDAQSLSSDRAVGAPTSGQALYIEIICSGEASAEHFPVVKD